MACDGRRAKAPELRPGPAHGLLGDIADESIALVPFALFLGELVLRVAIVAVREIGDAFASRKILRRPLLKSEGLDELSAQAALPAVA